jgi:translation initiation factor RLI1
MEVCHGGMRASQQCRRVCPKMRMVIPQFMAVSIGENRGKYGKMMINPYQSDSIGTSIPQKKRKFDWINGMDIPLHRPLI